MSTQTVLVKDAYGNVQTVDTSKTVTNVIGQTTDAALTNPANAATLIAGIKGLLQDSQLIAKQTTNYNINGIIVNASDVSKPSIGVVKGVMFEFSTDFVGTVAGLATKGSDTLTRYFEAPSGGNLKDVVYTITAGKVNIFKLTAE